MAITAAMAMQNCAGRERELAQAAIANDERYSSRAIVCGHLGSIPSKLARGMRNSSTPAPGDLQQPSPKTSSTPFFRYQHHIGWRKWDILFICVVPSHHGLLLDDLRHYVTATPTFGLGNRELRDRFVLNDIMVWCQFHHLCSAHRPHQTADLGGRTG